MCETSLEAEKHRKGSWKINLWFGFKSRDLNATVANSFSTDGSTFGSYLVFVLPETSIFPQVLSFLYFSHFLTQIAMGTSAKNNWQVFPGNLFRRKNQFMKKKQQKVVSKRGPEKPHEKIGVKRGPKQKPTGRQCSEAVLLPVAWRSEKNVSFIVLQFIEHQMSIIL